MRFEKFRKKPVVIEAVQYKIGWTHPAICNKADAPGIAGPHIHTLEGAMILSNYDWIVKGIKGEFYPVKPDIFEATYEEVSDGK
jgi:hypothetical protein